MTDIRPVPCIVCGTQPEPIRFADLPWHPWAAVRFNCTHGYGSRVWDDVTGDRYLTINVCDGCLVERKNRVAVVETIPREPEVTFTTWDGPYGQ